MDNVHVVIGIEGEKMEICGIYKQWSAAYKAVKSLEDQEEYDSVNIEEWVVE